MPHAVLLQQYLFDLLERSSVLNPSLKLRHSKITKLWDD
ncbi:hypothetical protein DQM08_12255 [Lactiplantibacillus paraplantarum]|nr:hypothetical protein DQM08_12255 [Lactiplantibacillus paraplantarum]